VKVLRLASSRSLLWARQGDAGNPFEVSRVVDGPLQAQCPTAPRCPAEEEPFARRAAWIDPHEAPPADCPYAFELRGDCLRHRNQVALEAALFRPGEVDPVRRLLEALGFDVGVEGVDPLSGETRILDAHGYIDHTHEVRLLRAPGGGQIVLVRDLEQPQRGGRRRRRRARGQP